MELRVVRIGLEDIQEVKRQFYFLFVVVAQAPGHGAEEALVVEHEFHVFVRKAEEEDAFGAVYFRLYFVLVKTFDVLVDVFDRNLRKV